jgi:aryl-alcohol dehydrogenase-like predicted oxidoreductase
LFYFLNKTGIIRKDVDFLDYRILGRTGFPISEVGIGGHEYARFFSKSLFPSERKFEEPIILDELLKSQFQRNIIITKALKEKINYFDTGFIEEAQSLGLALSTFNRRNEIYISALTVSPLRRMMNLPKAMWRDYIIDEIDNRVKHLKTNYIDIFNVHLPSDGYTRKRFVFFIQVLKELKKEGKIRSIGAADHINLHTLAELIRKFNAFDSIMIPYNYYFQETKHVIFPLCKKLNIGVVVMKALSWPFYGLSFTNFNSAPKLESSSLVQNHLNWILKSPEVSTIIVGINSVAELEENLNMFSNKLEVDERSLDEYLNVALSSEGKMKINQMIAENQLVHNRPDIKIHAKEALESFQNTKQNFGKKKSSMY